MTKHDYKQNAYYMLYLIRCVLHDKIPAKEKLDKMDLPQLYEVAQAHSLTAIIAYALESAGIYDEVFKQVKSKAIRKNILFDIEREKITAELETNEIWYMPLKGVILKDYYPRIGMRQMADNDILFDPARVDDVKQIMEINGFATEHFGGDNHDVYYKPPVCNFEMHNSLFEPWYGEKIYEYYVNVKNRLVSDDKSRFEFRFTDEDFYIYLLAHEYKHYMQGGTGLRNLVDRYVYLEHHKDLDFGYIAHELSLMGIADYEKESRNMISKLLSGNKLTNSEKEQLDYYIFSGTYGTTETLIHNQIHSLGGGLPATIKYVGNRIFVPISKRNPHYRAYKAQYPFFYNHRMFLPILPFYRLFHSLYKSKGRIITELRAIIKR